jgi:hypothetical protein
MSFWAEYKSDTRDVVFYVGCEPVWEPAFCPSVRVKWAAATQRFFQSLILRKGGDVIE